MSAIPNTFQTPNVIIDQFMPLLTDSEFRVLMWAVRQILGWHDKIETRRAEISLTNFEGCGLCRGTISRALKSLTSYRILEAVGEPGRKGQAWELRFMTKQDVDFDGLEERQSKRKKAGQRRTKKGRAVLATGLSDRPVLVSGTDQSVVSPTDRQVVSGTDRKLVSPTDSIKHKETQDKTQDKDISLSQEDSQARDPNPQPPTRKSERERLSLFSPYQDKFGNLSDLTESTRAEFLKQRERLGDAKALEVLERCAASGKSWRYVLTALKNETTLWTQAPISLPQPEAEPDIPNIPNRPKPKVAPIQPTARINHDWRIAGLNDVRPVSRAWEMFHECAQDTLQSEAATAIKGLTLVDFEPDSHTFIAVARSDIAHSLLQITGQYHLNAVNLLSDCYQQPAKIRVLKREDWPVQNEDELAA